MKKIKYALIEKNLKKKWIKNKKIINKSMDKKFYFDVINTQNKLDKKYLFIKSQTNLKKESNFNIKKNIINKKITNNNSYRTNESLNLPRKLFKEKQNNLIKLKKKNYNIFFIKKKKKIISKENINYNNNYYYNCQKNYFLTRKKEKIFIESKNFNNFYLNNNEGIINFKIENLNLKAKFKPINYHNYNINKEKIIYKIILFEPTYNKKFMKRKNIFAYNEKIVINSDFMSIKNSVLKFYQFNNLKKKFIYKSFWIEKINNLLKKKKIKKIGYYNNYINFNEENITENQFINSIIYKIEKDLTINHKLLYLNN